MSRGATEKSDKKASLLLRKDWTVIIRRGEGEDFTGSVYQYLVLH